MPLFNMRLSAIQFEKLGQIASFYGLTKTGLIEMWIGRWNARAVKTNVKTNSESATNIKNLTNNNNKAFKSKTKLNQEQKQKHFFLAEEAKALAAILAQKIMANNPKHKPISEKELDNWAHQATLMNRADRRAWDDILAHIEWAQADAFWRCNILSMKKLREQFDRLTMQMQNIGSQERKESLHERRRRKNQEAIRQFEDAVARLPDEIFGDMAQGIDAGNGGDIHGSTEKSNAAGSS